MGLRLRFALTVSVLAAWASAAAQTARYDFKTETCDASVTFDPAIYDKESVQNTADFLFGVSQGRFHARKADSDASLAACHADAERLRAIHFVDIASVHALAADIADRTDAYCDLKTLERTSLADPSVLRRFPHSEACYPAVDALEGRTDAVQFWRQMIASLAPNNVDPQGYLANQRAHEAAPDFHDWVRRQILTYGWHNCANGTLRPYQDAELLHRTQAEQEFSRAFKYTEQNCDKSSAD